MFFSRAHLSSQEPHITASSAQHTSAAGLVVHTSQKVFMFEGLETGEGGRWSLPAEVVGTIREALPYSFKRCEKKKTTGGSQSPDASVAVSIAF